MPLSEKRKFQNRMSKRTFIHGKSWRQIFVDCGGMCLNCGGIDALEFHEPFGEDKHGWGRLQARVLLCHDCHMKIEHALLFGNNPYVHISGLSCDVDAEILAEGGYNNWIKNHGLIDRFACLHC